MSDVRRLSDLACGISQAKAIPAMRAGHFEVSDSVMTPEELEFLAEEELITIIPKISTTEHDDAGRAGYLALLSGECSTDSECTAQHQHFAPHWSVEDCHAACTCALLAMARTSACVSRTTSQRLCSLDLRCCTYTCQLQAHTASSNQTSP